MGVWVAIEHARRKLREARDLPARCDACRARDERRVGVRSVCFHPTTKP